MERRTNETGLAQEGEKVKQAVNISRQHQETSELQRLLLDFGS